jgi:EAL and modified HD-GYP domain-containing signal transduction protein
VDIYLARQPIFDKKKKICAYELLFRDGPSNAFPNIDGDTASSKLLANSFFTMGFENITGGMKAYINFTENLILKKVPVMFPAQEIMVEVLEHVNPTRDVISACREMSQAGYGIALDDFLYKPDLKPLIAIANVIKMDFRATPMDEISAYVNLLSGFSVKFLAEKVETHDEFNKASNMGFEFFQGYFFSKPEIIKGRDVDGAQINLLQIMAEANKEDFRFKELETLISRNVSISYKLMRYMNSPYFRRVQEISSIRQAIVMLGESGVRRFVSLIAMAKLAGAKPDELLKTSIVRARLCELLGKEAGRGGPDGSELFTVGLFSLIDAILDIPMEAIMKKLPLSERIKQALLSGEGDLAQILTLAASYQQGDWDGANGAAAALVVNMEAVPKYYMESLAWADSLSTVQ